MLIDYARMHSEIMQVAVDEYGFWGIRATAGKYSHNLVWYSFDGIILFYLILFYLFFGRFNFFSLLGLEEQTFPILIAVTENDSLLGTSLTLIHQFI
jgi:hypothetical protein